MPSNNRGQIERTVAVGTINKKIDDEPNKNETSNKNNNISVASSKTFSLECLANVAENVAKLQ